MYTPDFLDAFDRLVAFDAETTGKRTPDADYAYRCTVTRTVFANVVAARAAAIDYPNFKGSLATAKGDQRPSTFMARSQAYHRTWDAMMDAQQELEPDTGRGAW